MKKILFLSLSVALALPSFGHAQNSPSEIDQLNQEKWDGGLYNGFSGRSDYEKYLENYCSRYDGTQVQRCFDLDKESAILNAIEATAEDAYVVVVGKKVILLNERQYARWQEYMEDNLAKAGEGLLKIILSPFKMATGAVVTVAGLLWSPFEERDHHGDLARQGAGLAVKGVGDVLTGAVATADGLTMGGPVYVVTLPFTASAAPAQEVVNAIKSGNQPTAP